MSKYTQYIEQNVVCDPQMFKRAKYKVLEVKSGRRKGSFPGIEAFSKEFELKRKLLVGPQGIPIKEFLLTSPEGWF